MAKRFRIKQFCITAFHPQLNRSLERSHHVLGEYLKQFVACSITIRYYYTRSRKSKWPELDVKYQVQWARIMMNTRLDSSVRIKTRIRTEVT